MISNNHITSQSFLTLVIEGWKSILLGLFAGAIFGIAMILNTPKVFEATAYLKVAKTMGQKIESLDSLEYKLKNKNYYSNLSNNECNFTNKKDFQRIKKFGDELEIKISSNSREKSFDCIKSIIEKISIEQANVAKPILDFYKKKLDNLLIDYKSQKEKCDIVFSMLDGNNINNINLLENYCFKIRDLQTSIEDIQFKLSEAESTKTLLLYPISIEQIPTNNTLLFLINLVAGLFISCFFIVGKHILQGFRN